MNFWCNFFQEIRHKAWLGSKNVPERTTRAKKSNINKLPPREKKKYGGRSKGQRFKK